MKSHIFAVVALFAVGLPAQTPIELSVDAGDASRRLLHVHMVVPVTTGRLRLSYPKWIPGEHSPTGPVADLVDLRVVATGKTIPWRRDPVDMYSFSVEVPGGVTSVDVFFDFISPPGTSGFTAGASTTSEMTVVSWNELLLYPEGKSSDAVQFKVTLKVPPGWRYGTALPIASETGDTIEFKPAPLTTLVDSPVIAGRHFRTIELTPPPTPHYLHLAADSAEALNLTPALIESYKQLVAETGALFGARHYRGYHFLVSLSDHVSHFGLEHHESSDNRIPEFAMVDEVPRLIQAGLLPHEMIHSWNGKYRRPAGLATPDYQKPMEGDLLWVYEGLTTYLGDILTPRSGLEQPEHFRQSLALSAASLDQSPGRRWRPLADTARAAQILYGSRSDWGNLRRSVDFYPEGSLIWLEADVIIRGRSGGARSLDDFCRRFFGGVSGPPELKTYTLDDVVTGLNAVEPYDWRRFFEERVNRVSDHAPLGGITGAGWRLVYRDELPSLLKEVEEERKTVDVRFSLGLSLREDGTIDDVLKGSPADLAGLSPTGQLLAVNGRQFTAKALRFSIRAAKETAEPIELIVKAGERYKVHHAVCRTGERYPALERDESKPDLLSEIIRAKAKR